jgi:hypothetical protein
MAPRGLAMVVYDPSGVRYRYRGPSRKMGVVDPARPGPGEARWSPALLLRQRVGLWPATVSWNGRNTKITTVAGRIAFMQSAFSPLSRPAGPARSLAGIRPRHENERALRTPARPVQTGPGSAASALGLRRRRYPTLNRSNCSTENW